MNRSTLSRQRPDQAKQPPDSPSKRFRERVGTAKGRIRRIAIVAVARKLLIALWRYLETGLVPTGAKLKASNR
jgi:transposase